MKLEAWCETDRGLKRETNQDSYLLNNELGLYIVADGMGGHLGGEVASSMAVQIAEGLINQVQSTEVPRNILKRVFREASHQIYDKSLEKTPDLSGMGTTMVMAFYREPFLYIANVGDSRAYMFKDSNLWQLTEDHSLVNEQVRAGLLSEDQAKNFASKNVITRSVGYEREVECDVIEREIQAGEYFLLCSDGLSGLVSNEQITGIIKENKPNQVVKKCIEAAKANGGDDNITALLIYFSP